MGKKERKRFFKYVREYRWADIFAMMRNNRSAPLTCPDHFHNRLVVITGTTRGIGYLTAREYASHGANLLCINRNAERSEAVCREIEKEYGVRCDHLIADLSTLHDTCQAGKTLSALTEPIDVLIHNAGIYLTKKGVTTDGLEKLFMVHYLSSFIINFMLQDKLTAQEKARIILVSSEGHRFAAWGLRTDDLNWERRRYSGLKSYGSAKTAQLLSMIIFREHFENTGVTINAMHPGAVKTNTGQENGAVYRWFKKHFFDKTLRSPEISATALYYLGVSPALAGVSGKFFNLTTEEVPAPPALDREVAAELWEKSLSLGGLHKKGTKPEG